MTKAAVLDTSLQRTHEWLHEVGRELGSHNERAAYAALRATLHAMRDRLPVELVAHLGAEPADVDPRDLLRRLASLSRQAEGSACGGFYRLDAPRTERT